MCIPHRFDVIFGVLCVRRQANFVHEGRSFRLIDRSLPQSNLVAVDVNSAVFFSFFMMGWRFFDSIEEIANMRNDMIWCADDLHGAAER